LRDRKGTDKLPVRAAVHGCLAAQAGVVIISYDLATTFADKKLLRPGDLRCDSGRSALAEVQRRQSHQAVPAAAASVLARTAAVWHPRS